MRYKILYSESSELLDMAVNDAIAKGWTPCGGVSVAQSNYHSTDHKGYSVDNFSRVFAQAITLKS